MLWWGIEYLVSHSPGSQRRWRRLVGRGVGARSRVENSWMLPLWPQRMFRAHIRCDQWCHLFCLGAKKNEIPLMITQWALCFWWGGLQCFCSDKQINTFNALCCKCAHMGIWCWEKCERRSNLRRWSQKVAFKKIKEYQTWSTNTSRYSLSATLPPSGRYIYYPGRFSVPQIFVFIELSRL